MNNFAAFYTWQSHLHWHTALAISGAVPIILGCVIGAVSSILETRAKLKYQHKWRHTK